MTQTQKTLERAMKEIERLKSQVLNLEKEPKSKSKPKYKHASLRLEAILKGRKAAMDRFNKKLFGGKNAKQK